MNENNDAALKAISPLDGRYSTACEQLKPIVSEYGLNYYRCLVEIKWLEKLSTIDAIGFTLSSEEITWLNNIMLDYPNNAQDIKEIEKTTNHDVKAVEYFLKNRIHDRGNLAQVVEFIHFACTSEDINNLSYGLMLKDLKEKIFLPHLQTLLSTLQNLAQQWAAIPMLSRTHGQAASPTTVGKEIANVAFRLERQIQQFSQQEILGKMNGAVGNFNAHVAAFPEVKWDKITHEFVEGLGLTWNPLTTQIEPHDALAEYMHCLIRIDTILIDFARDIWGYISVGYFKQKTVEGEVGSSTMPHKVNPIDFENAEGNFGLATALFAHFAEKLPISRWQRDLTDSTVLRNIGVGCGYMLIALKALLKGINKLEINIERIEHDLNDNWEVLGEALQTVMRKEGIEQPYEKLKALTRGKKVTRESLHQFIDSLNLKDSVKEQLKKLTPGNYIGLAEKLALHQ